MSIHLTTFEGSVTDAIERAIKDAIPDAQVEARGGGGHFNITVRSAVFAGKSKLQSHRLVLGAIKHLLSDDPVSGARAPVHAVDTLHTLPLEG